MSTGDEWGPDHQQVEQSLTVDGRFDSMAAVREIVRLRRTVDAMRGSEEAARRPEEGGDDVRRALARLARYATALDEQGFHATSREIHVLVGAGRGEMEIILDKLAAVRRERDNRFAGDRCPGCGMRLRGGGEAAGGGDDG